MSIYDEIVTEAETKFNAGGSKTFKFKEGVNQIRVLAAGRPYQSLYMGERKTNYIHWILDRADGKMKLAFLPYTIVKTLQKFGKDPELGFENPPMPYDIKVDATKAGTKEVDYAVLPTRPTDLTEKELQQMEKLAPIDQLRDKLKAKADQEIKADADEISSDDIPN